LADKSVLATITGELFQPVRLHYRVFDDKGLLQALTKLSCVKHDPPRQRWVWLYEDEARGLSFKQSYAQISEKLRPIVLGSLIHRTSDTLLLDLRSHERAMAAIPFFDKHIPRGVAKVTEAEVANKLYSTDNPQLSPEDVFDHQPATVRDPEAEFQRLAEQVKQGRSFRARLDILLKAFQSATQKPLPETERIPVHYYEDGIGGFTLALTLRQIVAREHWSGNTKYTLSDAITATTKSM
jgi:hypothetical protein